MQDLPASAVVLASGSSVGFDPSGVASTLRFEVPDADVAEFLQAVAGLPRTFTSGGVSFTRTVPLEHPDQANAYATGVRGYAADGSLAYPTPNGGITYDFWWFDVYFGTPAYSYDSSDPLVTISRSITSEMVTRPGTAYVFPSDGKCINQAAGVKVQVVKYSITFHRLNQLNHALYDSLAGCVSSQPFRGADAGKTLYLGCSDTQTTTIGGISSYAATHEFEVRSIEHNKIMRFDGQGFEAPVQVGTTDKYLIPTADLNALIGN